MKKIVTSGWQTLIMTLLVCQCITVAVAQVKPINQVSNGVWSGFYDDKDLIRIEKITCLSIEEDFKLMLSYLTPTEKDKLGKITLVFPPKYGRHPMNFYAETIKGEKRIVLPQSSLRFLSDICLAYAYSNRHKLNEGVISEYLSIIRYQWPTTIKSKPYRPLDALGIDRKQALANKDVDSLFGKLYSTAIWFIIYHELGHHFYQHPGNDIPNKEKSRQNETDADKFALTLLRRVGDPPFGGIVTFFWIDQHFTSFTEADSIYHHTATHPLTANRLRAVATNLSRYADRYARNQTDPKRFQASYQAIADEIQLMGDNLANGKFWKLVQVAGQAGNIEHLNVHRSGLPTTTVTDSKGPFIGSFSGYWIDKENKENRMLVKLRLYSQEGQLKGDGLLIDPDKSRHSPELSWQITNGKVDNETLHFAWQMGSYNVGTGELKHTKSGLSGSWDATQERGTKKLGNLVLTRTP